MEACLGGGVRMVVIVVVGCYTASVRSFTRLWAYEGGKWYGNGFAARMTSKLSRVCDVGGGLERCEAGARARGHFGVARLASSGLGCTTSKLEA